jgi:excisionase family DNA binding protein
LAVAKLSTKDETIFGLSGAANYLGCDGRTVREYADAQRLSCTRDSSGKRLFRLADLQEFKRNNRIGNQRRASNYARA